MQTILDVRKLQTTIRLLKKKGKTVGFVPTMGFLHEGHGSLLKKCKAENDISVLSIFVNPAQFGPNEDFLKYPRDKKKDERLAKKRNVDIIFYPSVEKMYPQGYSTTVVVENLSDVLCGKFRPGHFKGVTTVVAKLLNLVSPDVMYLGQKDAQQAVIIQKMVEDLNFPVKIKVLPTVREQDGLAMSSRNSYLTPEERKAAPILYQALSAAQRKIQSGQKNSQAIIRLIGELIETKQQVSVEYIDCVEAKTLKTLGYLQGDILIALAVRFGSTRLIDNLVLRVS